jgi:cytochrome P450
VSTQNLSFQGAASQPLSTATIAELDADPHGRFRHYRGEAPFLQRADGAYLALRAADVEALTSDPRTRQLETELIQSRGITSGPLFEIFQHSMLFANGEVHRQRRAPMSRAFAFRAVGGIRPYIRRVAETLIDAHLSAGEMNLVDDYAVLIPAHVIASILGLPEDDVPSFTAWVYSFSRAFSASFTPAEVPDIIEAAAQLRDYATSLIADRRANPREDFIKTFVRAAEEAGEITPTEMMAQLVTVIVGGSDTTRSAMAIQVALLLQHHEQWEAVCRDASLIPGAVAEALRYEPAVGSVPRFTLADIERDGYVVPAGHILILSTLSAMRDPALYSDPDRFDISRTDHPRWHIVFGSGAHRCLGEALARAELEEGLGALAARLPGLRISGAPLRLHGHGGIRQIEQLHVAWAK